MHGGEMIGDIHHRFGMHDQAQQFESEHLGPGRFAESVRLKPRHPALVVEKAVTQGMAEIDRLLAVELQPVGARGRVSE